MQACTLLARQGSVNRSAVRECPGKKAAANFKHGNSGIWMCQLVPAPNIGHAALITDYDDLRAAFDRLTIIAASSARAPSSRLREDDLADTAAVAYSIADTCDHTRHLGVCATSITRSCGNNTLKSAIHSRPAPANPASDASRTTICSLKNAVRNSRYPAPPNHVTNASTVNALMDEMPLWAPWPCVWPR